MGWLVILALLAFHVAEADAASPSVSGSAGEESSIQQRRDAEQRRALEARKSRSERQSDTRSASRSRTLSRAASAKLDVTQQISASTLFSVAMTELESVADDTLAGRIGKLCQLYNSGPWLYSPFRINTSHPARPRIVKSNDDLQTMLECFVHYAALEHATLSRLASTASATGIPLTVDGPVVSDAAEAHRLVLSAVRAIAPKDISTIVDNDGRMLSGQVISSPIQSLCQPDYSNRWSYPVFACAHGSGLTHVSNAPDGGSAIVTASSYTHDWQHRIGPFVIDTMAREMMRGNVALLSPRGSRGLDVTINVATSKSIELALRTERSRQTSVASSKESSTSTSMSKSRATGRSQSDSASTSSRSDISVSPRR